MHLKTEDILSSLVNINTSNPPGNEKDLINLILSYFGNDINHEIIDHKNNRGSLVITIKGLSTKSIALIGHLDTVPVSDPLSWKYPPFDGYIEDGYLYGRGSADMKGGLTAMIKTGLYFIENQIVPPYNIKLIFTADEESDGIGITEIRRMGFLDDVDGVIITEPTNEKIGICEKGALWLNIKVTGKESHASKPDRGINAIERLFELVTSIRKFIDFDKTHSLLGNTTFTITTIKGGVKTNIVPSFAEATVDIRTVPGVNQYEIINVSNLIGRKMIEEGSIKDFSLEVTNNREPISIGKNSQFIQSIEDSFKKLGHTIEHKGLFFYTDASQIIPFMEIPFVIIGPGEEEMAHQTNERINLASIDRMAEFYIKFIMESYKF